MKKTNTLGINLPPDYENPVIFADTGKSLPKFFKCEEIYKAVKSMLFRYFIILSIVVCAILSCKKDEPLSSYPCQKNDKCKSIPDAPPFGWNYIYRGKAFESPCFNPKNENEILFVDQSGLVTQQKLYAFNLISRNFLLLCEGHFLSRPKWGLNDWIVFCFQDNNIWKIKSNGDSLVQVTTSGDFFFPTWDYRSIRIIANLSTIQKAVFLTPEGEIIDTLKKFSYGGGFFSFVNDSIIVTSSYQGLGIYNLNSDVISILHTAEISSYSGIYVSCDSTVTWIDESGMYVSSISTPLKTKKIFSSCNSQMYLSPTLSADCKRICWEKITKKALNKNDLQIEYKLVFTNLEGICEEELQIPL